MKIKEKWDKDKLYFTSDTHFNHTNIIGYINRPFKTVEDMNKDIIRKWNNVVPADGIVFHLGDVSLTARDNSLLGLLNGLNGTKHLIIGNHEKDAMNCKNVLKVLMIWWK